MNDDMLAMLQALIASRRTEAQPGSYTAGLLEAGIGRIAQKVGEEATEVVVAALSQGKREQIAEISDLFFHLLVLMNELEITLDDIHAELARRHQRAQSEERPD